MTNPREHGFPSRVCLSDRSGSVRNTARPRPSGAFVAAVAILLGGGLLLEGAFAWANSGGKIWAPWDPVPEVAAIPVPRCSERPETKRPRASGRAVCVRLCDGFFFPSATSSGGDEACAAQCPDAPTARYTEPVGSDRIEDAVSTRGALYTLCPWPIAIKLRSTTPATCHRAPTRGYSESLLNDPTLRKGDVVMTPKGFVVFQGAKTRSIASSDFVALSQARSLPKDLRAALVDMERAGPSQRQLGAYSSLRRTCASERGADATGVSSISKMTRRSGPGVRFGLGTASRAAPRRIQPRSLLRLRC
jgi:hypothetical protein